MKTQRLWMTAAVSILLAACGSSNASVSGSVNGVTPGDHATAVNLSVSVGGVSVPTLTVFFDNAPAVCADLQSGVAVANDRELVISVLSTDPGGNPQAISTGAFTIGAAIGNIANATTSSTDGSCVSTGSGATASSGTVTLTQFSATGASGTFDLTFAGPGGSLKGSFDTSICAVTTIASNASCHT